MNQFKKIIVLVGAMAGLISANAFAVSISLYGVGSDDMPNVTGGFAGTTASRLAYGGGATVEFSLGSHVGLEIGAMYMNRRFDNPPTLGLTDAFFQVPVDLDFHFNRYLSLFIGGYGDMPLNATYGTDAGTTVSPPISNKLNYGVNGGLAIHIPLGGSTALLLSGEYEYGLANLAANTANTFNYRDVVVKAGFTFGMGRER